MMLIQLIQLIHALLKPFLKALISEARFDLLLQNQKAIQRCWSDHLSEVLAVLASMLSLG